MEILQREIDATWLAGLLDGVGYFGIKDNKPFVQLKTTEPDRIVAAETILGMAGKSYGPFDNGGDSKRPQYALDITGGYLVLLENLVARRMRTARRHLFQQLREQVRRLRNQIGRSGPGPGPGPGKK
ncbi:hypothetical protein [Bradyrhizobium sp. URHA0013]|uniref:hypothetical protein n=1 Tax=Bradyrhizobium sp. URHA0013 TaxID=1380352 RepID=UPI000481B243|nr:hypothetical protein [Bradyrhizobium sp. URHA0013]